MTEVLRPLPESVQEIAEVIGRDKALWLIGQLPRSGKRSWRVCFYVPKTLSPNHKLVAMLGWHDAKRMVNAFSGMILQPSNCSFLVTDARHRRVRELNAEGHTAREIAEQLEISECRVREVIAGRRVSTGANRKV